MLCPCCRNISIHAPPRGATRPVCLLVVVDNNFNSRPSARGDLSICPSTHVSVFQFTPLREGRRSILAKSEVRTYFNSRPSARGDGAWCVLGILESHFNSRPSARGDVLGYRIRSLRCISIHAPPRGATWRRIWRHSTTSFQFTPLREGRHLQIRGILARFVISIHAPPRGATTEITRRRKSTLFQFTPLREGRRCIVHREGSGIVFQFTPLREGRRPDVPLHPVRSYFNSRPSARGDIMYCRINRTSTHFNSRPSARGDRMFRPKTPLCLISIHAPPRGATGTASVAVPFFLFQFTPLREGRRLERRQLCCIKHDFNSRPSARGDSKRYAISANLLFNPYKSAWLNNNATQFVEIILVIFHRIIA